MSEMGPPSDPLDSVVAMVGVLFCGYLGLIYAGYGLVSTVVILVLVGLLYYLANKKTPTLPSGFGVRYTAIDVSEGFDLKGKIAIVTGPTSGIGLETAYAFAFRGAQVVMAARDKTKCEATIRDLLDRLSKSGRNVNESPFTFIELDLGSFASVDSFVETYLKTFGQRLHILVNNAGIMAMPSHTETKDGRFRGLFSSGWHLPFGPFSFDDEAQRRIDRQRSKSCGMCFIDGYPQPSFFRSPPINLETLPYNGWIAYGNAKAANLLFAREFNNRFASSGVTAYSLHPGGIHTGLQTHVDWYLMLKWLIVTPFAFKSVEQGAATSVFCALSPHAVPGGYHNDCNPMPKCGVDATHELCMDESVLRTFWDASETAMKGKK